MNDPQPEGSHGKLHRTTKILSHARRRGCMAARGARAAAAVVQEGTNAMVALPAGLRPASTMPVVETVALRKSVTVTRHVAVRHRGVTVRTRHVAVRPAISFGASTMPRYCPRFLMIDTRQRRSLAAGFFLAPACYHFATQLAGTG